MPFFKSFAKSRAAAVSEDRSRPSPAVGLTALEKRWVFDAALAGELAGLVEAKAATHDPSVDDGSLGAMLAAASAPVATTADTSAAAHEIWIVDGGVENREALIAGLPAGAEVVVLDPARDGVTQIAEALAGRSGIDAVHVFAHGSSGELSLGSSLLDASTMNGVYASTLAEIGSHLSANADLMIYGCDFAEGTEGAAAADLLASLTGADVAASTDLTGSAALGGDWVLEHHSGAIEARSVAIDGWDGTLAVAMISAGGAPTTNGLHNVGAQATWANVATVGGQPVDIRATVISADAGATVTFGVTGDDLRMELENGTARVQWELFQAGTAIPVAADINFQITDLDGASVESVSAATTSYTVEAATNLAVSTSLGVTTAAGTQNQNSESTSMIRFSWAGISSMTVDYSATVGTDIRIFNHDGDLDLAFSSPVTVGTPVLDLDANTGGSNYATTFTENGPSIGIVDPTVDITGSTNVQSATIVLTNAKPGDTLSLGSLPGGITGNVDTSVGGQITVTLAGNTTAANYETALRAIGFANSSDTPDTTARTVTFTLQSGPYTSATSTTTIAVVPVNDPPVAGDDTYRTPIDTAITRSVAGNDSDPEGDTLTFAVGTGPAHGTLSFNANGSFTYTPSAGWFGTDTFTYTANDGNGGTDTATVTIVVNTPPVAGDDTVTTATNTPVNASVAGNDSDANGDPLTFAVATTPSHGSVTVNADGSYTYTPTSGYAGADSFTYTVSDGQGGTDTATVNVTVLNGAPVAVTDTVSTGYQTPLNSTVAANDSDPNGDPLTFALATGPSNGSVSVAANGSFTYTPNAGYSGADSFTYTVSDGNGGSATGTVNVTVGTNPNSPPVAVDDSVTTATNTPVNASVAGNDSDPNGDPLSFALATGPSHGSVTVAADGSYTYTPTSGYAGADSFTYTVSDGRGGTASATVNVTVSNGAPVAGADTVSTPANTPVNATVAGNDSDPNGDPLSFALATGPSHGSVTMAADGSYTYTPTSGYSGADSFTYTVSDGHGGTATATVSVTVSNAAPVIGVIAAQTGIDRQVVSLDVGALTTDVDGPSRSFSATGLPPGLAIDSVTGVISGTLDRAASVSGSGGTGNYTVVVTVVDGAGGSANRNFGWTVTNPGPTAVDDTFTTSSGTPVSGSVAGNDGDPDGDALTWAPLTTPGHGTVAFASDGTFTYTPTGGWAGSDSFTYRVTDAQGAVASATVTVTVANRAPTPVGTVADRTGADASSVTLDTSTAFTDADLQALTYTATGLPPGLSINPVTGVISGTIDRGASGSTGTGSFAVTVTATDPYGAAAAQSFVWRVTNPQPVAVADTFSTTGTTQINGSVAGNDWDPDGDALGFTLVGQAAHGTVTFNADGSFAYRAHDLFAGTDTFTYQVRDANGGTATATVTVQVAAPTTLSGRYICLTTFGDLSAFKRAMNVSTTASVFTGGRSTINPFLSRWMARR